VDNVGFWQGAYRDPSDPAFKTALRAIKDREPVTINLLYGDFEGGQRVISRFVIRPGHEGDAWLNSAIRHWNLDRDDPR
jgi:hypothetical protein